MCGIYNDYLSIAKPIHLRSRSRAVQSDIDRITFFYSSESIFNVFGDYGFPFIHSIFSRFSLYISNVLGWLPLFYVLWVELNRIRSYWFSTAQLGIFGLARMVFNWRGGLLFYVLLYPRIIIAVLLGTLLFVPWILIRQFSEVVLFLKCSYFSLLCGRDWFYFTTWKKLLLYYVYKERWVLLDSVLTWVSCFSSNFFSHRPSHYILWFHDHFSYTSANCDELIFPTKHFHHFNCKN